MYSQSKSFASFSMEDGIDDDELALQNEYDIKLNSRYKKRHNDL
jgi:hypothetical protein